MISFAKRLIRSTVWPLTPEVVKRTARAMLAERQGVKEPADETSEADALAGRFKEIVEGGPARPLDGTIHAGRALTTPESVDLLVGYAHHAAARSHDALLRMIHSFHYRFPPPPKNPHSDEYREFWGEQYRLLSQRDYSVTNELHDFDIDHPGSTYPYNTRDPKIIALHIIATGAILEAIPMHPPARVLEMGVGWGNTALQIGKSGYDVTVLDIEQKYLEIVRRKFEREGLSVTCVNGEFLDAEKLEGKFDVILFYECFHHCLEHRALLQALKRKLTKGGVILFAGEPIDNSLPFAWGLNPSGQGAWSIRHHGWMELVFTERYFLELLESSGFSVRKNNSPHSAQSTVYTATLL